MLYDLCTSFSGMRAASFHTATQPRTAPNLSRSVCGVLARTLVARAPPTQGMTAKRLNDAEDNAVCFQAASAGFAGGHCSLAVRAERAECFPVDQSARVLCSTVACLSISCSL
jgi:hypothetical protein